MSHIIDLLSINHILALSAIAVTYLLSVRMYPVIIYISREKRLMATPGERNSHSKETPSLGGVGLFVAFSLSLILFGMVFNLNQQDLIRLLSILGATIILLFLGVKDDLIILAPKQKFLGQLISSCIVIFMTDVRIYDFNGLLGIGELPYLVSVVFTLFVFILVINAYNLIDGIDGLAGSIAIIASLSFGVFFAVNDHYLLLLVSLVLIGALIGFLRYNLSDSRKLFMGDSGSLFVGYLLAYQGISFLHLNASVNTMFSIDNAPLLLLAVLSFPLLDTLRVFAIRIKQKKSPFLADRNHIHHRLLDIGCSHKQATVAISLANLLVILVALALGSLDINLQLFLVVLTGIALYLTPFMFSLKPGFTALQNTNGYEAIVDLETLNTQVKLRNELLAMRKAVERQNNPKSGAVFGDEFGTTNNKAKESLARRRSWKLRNLLSSSSRGSNVEVD